jgi:hypothetical protein
MTLNDSYEMKFILWFAFQPLSVDRFVNNDWLGYYSVLNIMLMVLLIVVGSWRRNQKILPVGFSGLYCPCGFDHYHHWPCQVSKNI